MELKKDIQQTVWDILLSPKVKKDQLSKINKELRQKIMKKWSLNSIQAIVKDRKHLLVIASNNEFSNKLSFTIEV